MAQVTTNINSGSKSTTSTKETAMKKQTTGSKGTKTSTKAKKEKKPAIERVFAQVTQMGKKLSKMSSLLSVWDAAEKLAVESDAGEAGTLEQRDSLFKVKEMVLTAWTCTKTAQEAIHFLAADKYTPVKGSKEKAAKAKWEPGCRIWLKEKRRAGFEAFFKKEDLDSLYCEKLVGKKVQVRIGPEPTNGDTRKMLGIESVSLFTLRDPAEVAKAKAEKAAKKAAKAAA